MIVTTVVITARACTGSGLNWKPRVALRQENDPFEPGNRAGYVVEVVEVEVEVEVEEAAGVPRRTAACLVVFHLVVPPVLPEPPDLQQLISRV
ncbi:hypothetical protein Dda_7107 [Drechslerella dactyloides]|uniref:Uncharacterized protein n=1 Tax=Drechslerella dactyloides TaxID=74499 RepID=A0AAD6NIR2_DREDA|nr:hypothetical protein Dda_7107 [Drechslerella dactyloides]